MDNKQLEACRAEFEKWFLERNSESARNPESVMLLGRYDQGEYINALVIKMFSAFQAAWQHSRPAVQADHIGEVNKMVQADGDPDEIFDAIESLLTRTKSDEKLIEELSLWLEAADTRLEVLAYRDGKLNMNSVHRQKAIQKANQRLKGKE